MQNLINLTCRNRDTYNVKKKGVTSELVTECLRVVFSINTRTYLVGLYDT